MNDTINKDNINNDLNDEVNDKPLEKSKSLKKENTDLKSTLPENKNKEEITESENTEIISEDIPIENNRDTEIEIKHIEEIKEINTEEIPAEEIPDFSLDEIPEDVKNEIVLDDSGQFTKEDIKTYNGNNEEKPKEVSIDNASIDSNYLISLIDERILRIRTSTNQSVSIDCNVILKEELQSNKIFIHPKAEETKQEVEVLVKIGSDEKAETTAEDGETTETAEKKKKESNYQVTLISENILRVKISTQKSVSVDCTLLDKTTKEDGEETQSNKIFIHPKQGIGKQDVEIFVKIGTDAIKEETKSNKLTANIQQENPKPKLTPNPIVADILNRINKPKIETDDIEPEGLTDEERLELRIGKKNPWKRNKEFLLNNLYKGAVAANIIAIIAMIVFYAAASKKQKEDEAVEQRRLIVMQDLPENLNMQNQNVDDPNKPPEQPKDDGTTGTDIVPPVVTPKKVRPPKINLPKLNNNNLTENDTTINKELDSLRKKNNITGNQNGKNDTGAVNTSLMPDSLLKNLSENEVGLAGRFPPNWKQIDARTINLKDDFKGILLVDTTAKSKEEALNMFIELDPKGEKMTQFQFKRVFEEDSLRTVFALDPKQEGKLTYYRFYVASKTDNVFVNTFVVQSAFEKYKAEIERVVKTIQIRKPDKK